MNYAATISCPGYVGIFELDTAGTVLYSRQTQNNQLIGQNFFDEVANFENVPDFRRRFRNFISSHSFKEDFSFLCRSLDGNIPVRVLMLRTTERSESRSNDIVILDIRKNEF